MNSSSESKEEKNFEKRLLLELQLSLVGFAVLIFAWIFFTVRQFQHRQRRKGRSEHVTQVFDNIEDGKVEGRYVLSIETGKNYQPPEHVKVLFRIVGDNCHGRLHIVDSNLCSEDSEQIFAPRVREKFVIHEDVYVGNLKHIIIQNENQSSANWICDSIILRDIDTNEAWMFPCRGLKIGFPPEPICALYPEELTSFKFSYFRRFRREWKNGQHTFFGFWHWSEDSVYSFTQRLVTAVLGHWLLFSLISVFSNIILTPGRDVMMSRFMRYLHSVQPSTIAFNETVSMLYGETETTIWLYHILIVGGICSVLTSALMGVLAHLFRERAKYENYFDELDYVIGTALKANMKTLKQRNIAERERAKRAAAATAVLSPKRSSMIRVKETPTTPNKKKPKIKKRSDSDAKAKLDKLKRKRRLTSFGETGVSIGTYGILHFKIPPIYEISELDEQSDDENSQKPPNSQIAPAVLKDMNQLHSSSILDSSGEDYNSSSSEDPQAFSYDDLEVDDESPEGTFNPKNEGLQDWDLPNDKQKHRSFPRPYPAWIYAAGIAILCCILTSLSFCFSKINRQFNPLLWSLIILATYAFGILVITFFIELIKIAIMAIFLAKRDMFIYTTLSDPTNTESRKTRIQKKRGPRAAYKANRRSINYDKKP